MHRNRWLLNGIRLDYILAGFLSFIAGFAHLVVRNQTVDIVIGVSLATALALHEFVQSLRTMLMTTKAFRSLVTKEHRGAMFAHALFNWFILTLLLSFNGVMLFNTFTAKDTGQPAWDYLTMDRWMAVIIPVLGLLSSLAIEIEDSVSDVLRNASHEIAMRTARATVRQVSTDVEKARQNGHSLMPILASLMTVDGEEHESQRLGIIEEGLEATRSGVSVKTHLLQRRQTLLKSGARALGLTPGKVTVKPAADDSTFDSQSDTPIEGAKWVSRKPRSRIKLTPEQKVRQYLDKNPGASNSAVAKGAGVSINTVKKYRPT